MQQCSIVELEMEALFCLGLEVQCKNCQAVELNQLMVGGTR